MTSDVTLTMHAAVYSKDTFNKTFLVTTQDVLRGIAGLADELAQLSIRCMGEISRVVAQLNLAYHQVCPNISIALDAAC